MDEEATFCFGRQSETFGKTVRISENSKYGIFRVFQPNSNQIGGFTNDKN